MSRVYHARRKFAPTYLENGKLESQRHMASGVLVECLQGKHVWRLLYRGQDVDQSAHFNWGYAGSGPAALAEALCVDALGVEIGSQRPVFQRFKTRFLAGEQRDDWKLERSDIIDWYIATFKEPTEGERKLRHD